MTCPQTLPWQSPGPGVGGGLLPALTTGLAGASGSWAWDRRQRGQWGGHLAPAPHITCHTHPRAAGAAGSGTADHRLLGVRPLAPPHPTPRPAAGSHPEMCWCPEMTFLAKWHLTVYIGGLAVGGQVGSGLFKKLKDGESSYRAPRLALFGLWTGGSGRTPCASPRSRSPAVNSSCPWRSQSRPPSS